MKVIEIIDFLAKVLGVVGGIGAVWYYVHGRKNDERNNKISCHSLIITIQNIIAQLDIEWENSRQQYYTKFYQKSKNSNHPEVLVVSEKIKRIKYCILNQYEVLAQMILVLDSKDTEFITELYHSEIHYLLRDPNMIELIREAEPCSYPKLLKMKRIIRFCRIYDKNFKYTKKHINKKLKKNKDK